MIANRTRAALQAAQSVAISTAETTALLVGAGSITYGAWLIYAPVGFIAGGILLMAGVILNARGG